MIIFYPRPNDKDIKVEKCANWYDLKFIALGTLSLCIKLMEIMYYVIVELLIMQSFHIFP